jgi:hypothetical protein
LYRLRRLRSFFLDVRDRFESVTSFAIVCGRFIILRSFGAINHLRRHDRLEIGCDRLAVLPSFAIVYDRFAITDGLTIVLRSDAIVSPFATFVIICDV